MDFALIGEVEQVPVAGVEKLAVFNFRKVTLTYSDLCPHNKSNKQEVRKY